MQVSFICQIGRSGNCTRPNVRHFEIESIDQILEVVKDVPFPFNIIQVDGVSYNAKTSQDVVRISQLQGWELDW